MPRHSAEYLRRIPAFGIDAASKLAGIAECALRKHVDQGRLMGVRKLPSGKRLITREGLLTYLRARGVKPLHTERIERRGHERVEGHVATRISLELSDRRLPEPLGTAEGPLANISRTGLQVRDLSWTGCLPGPDSILAGRILGGSLTGTGMTLRLAWVVFQGKKCTMGLRLEQLTGPDARARWERFIRAGIKAKRHAGLKLYSAMKNQENA